MAGVGFQREAVWLTSLTRPRPFPPETASKRAGASEHDLGPPHAQAAQRHARQEAAGAIGQGPARPEKHGLLAPIESQQKTPAEAPGFTAVRMRSFAGLVRKAPRGRRIDNLGRP